MILSFNISPRYAETDQMGIIHHSVYPIWFEECRTKLMMELGLPYVKIEEMGVQTPIIELFSKYVAPSRYGDIVTIKTCIAEITGVKIRFNYECFINGKIVNTGYTIHAFVNKELKVINIKKSFPTVYQLLSECIEE